MFGTAHFYDGHTEPIINYQFNPTGTELYFTTCSGRYGFKDHIKHDNEFLFRDYGFYKYDQHWFVTLDICYIELFTEVLTHD